MSASTIQQSSTLPPAQPGYIFRGHTAQVHSLKFYLQNLRLISGDADGWVVIWDTIIKRPKVVWRAHESTVLGVNNWGEDRVITHGRDNKLNVWQIKLSDEDTLSSILPAEKASNPRKEPWLLHSLLVNTLNFCSFAMCLDPNEPEHQATTADESDSQILLAVPGTRDTEINVFHLPSERRVHIVPALSFHTGMVMALSVFYDGPDLRVAAGYEGGHSALHTYSDSAKNWTTSDVIQSHKQPVLSLDLHVQNRCYFTSGADDIICCHRLPAQQSFENAPQSADAAENFIHTKHSGQQSLKIRSDGRIFATAGWDGRLRVYSTKTMQELAVLKWHKEGCYAVTFASIQEFEERSDEGFESQKSSSSLAIKNAQQRREEKAKTTHWLAAGSKDGKVSLWEIY